MEQPDDLCLCQRDVNTYLSKANCDWMGEVTKASLAAYDYIFNADKPLKQRERASGIVLSP